MHCLQFSLVVGGHFANGARRSPTLGRSDSEGEKGVGE